MDVVLITVISSAVSMIVNKLFESYQNTLKHKRTIKEKVIEAKLEACKNAIRYYGTYLNSLYNYKATLESIESKDYFKLLSDSNNFHSKILSSIQYESKFHDILLFYDFYKEEDEKIAKKLNDKYEEYFEYLMNIKVKDIIDVLEEIKMRNELIIEIDKSIKYFKMKFEVVRNDINGLPKLNFWSLSYFKNTFLKWGFK